MNSLIIQNKYIFIKKMDSMAGRNGRDGQQDLKKDTIDFKLKLRKEKLGTDD